MIANRALAAIVLLLSHNALAWTPTTVNKIATTTAINKMSAVTLMPRMDAVNKMPARSAVVMMAKAKKKKKASVDAELENMVKAAVDAGVEIAAEDEAKAVEAKAVLRDFREKQQAEAAAAAEAAEEEEEAETEEIDLKAENAALEQKVEVLEAALKDALEQQISQQQEALSMAQQVAAAASEDAAAAEAAAGTAKAAAAPQASSGRLGRPPAWRANEEQAAANVRASKRLASGANKVGKGSRPDPTVPLKPVEQSPTKASVESVIEKWRRWANGGT